MKRGFTLIELLAVIVILAIIALIATPIILNIINDARKSSDERSAELYISAVEQAVARYNLTEELGEPITCIIGEKVMCNGKEVNVEISKKATRGTIVFTNGKITAIECLNINEKMYSLNSSGNIEETDLSACIQMPDKGQTINIDLDGDGNSEQYLVLKTSNRHAEIAAKYSLSGTVQFNSTSSVTTFSDGTQAQKYQNSNLDNYLNVTWYNTLSSTAKEAIIPQNKVQDVWGSGVSENDGDLNYRGTYLYGSYKFYKVGNSTYPIGYRNVYALSIQDIIDYFEIEPSSNDFIYPGIISEFWSCCSANTTTKHMLLSSASANGETTIWTIYGQYGMLNNTATYSSSYDVQPVMTIDLSKINWS